MRSHQLMLTISFALIGSVISLNVDQCPGLNLKHLTNRIKISGCNEPPCVLRKQKTYNIELTFKPEHEIQKVTNNVKAIIKDIPIPFFGVDGKNVCDKIFLASNPQQNVPCPLKGHTEYIYKDSFPVLGIYPSIPDFNIFWSLTTEKQATLYCCIIPAKIR